MMRRHKLTHNKCTITQQMNCLSLRIFKRFMTLSTVCLNPLLSKRKRQTQNPTASVKTYFVWLTIGWSCGWCLVWWGRARGRLPGQAGFHFGSGVSPWHPHPAAAAKWGESGRQWTESEHPEDPSPLLLHTDAGSTGSLQADEREGEGEREKERNRDRKRETWITRIEFKSFS